MRKFIVLGIAAATACAVFAAVALATNTSTSTETFSPSTIPTGKYKGGGLEAHLTTLDDTDPGTSTAPTKQPVPTTRVKVFLDHALKVTTNGLPQCQKADLEGTTTAGAEAVCGPGSGNNAEVTLTNAGASNPGSATVCVGTAGPGSPCGAVVSGVITAYNGAPTTSGQPVLFLHTRVGAPLSTTSIIRGVLKNTSTAPFKKFLDATVPLLGGGAASLTDFDVTLRRNFSTAPVLHYLKATCDDGLWNWQSDFTYADTSTETAFDTQACTAS